MNWRSLSFAPLLLAALLVGCRPERTRGTAVNPRTMTFGQAGVSLIVGEEWRCRKADSEHAAFPPTLAGPAGTIRVVLLPPDRSDPAMVADSLRANFDLNPCVAKHSFRKAQFASDKGVNGLCVSYLQRASAKRGEPTVESLHYLVQNRAGRCVAIEYVAASEDANTYAVRRMLQAGLSLQ